MAAFQCNNRTSGKTLGYGGHARAHGGCVGVVCDETRTVCREVDTACGRRRDLAESAAGQLLPGIPKFRADMARKLH
ncbi:hypothetical protein [Paraburkholderia sp. SIMBA_027]|uniref:hypothetical protein n=1 Tax=Paraburkholderia sp. SIMBA_027 TaxID=3085770 RepID=UPI003978EA00